MLAVRECQADVILHAHARWVTIERMPIIIVICVKLALQQADDHDLQEGPRRLRVNLYTKCPSTS